ncbi:RNA polymerase sigma factor SigF [Euzebya tangerina]|uniref:RNA polymerase sigma factor SigF n=1 Tax=Euzebya tangerina TaxID=591198 RepID=UPI0013C3622F|nr:RNA polymerase sigma factor SigF [Euzebya tangerina]
MSTEALRHYERSDTRELFARLRETGDTDVRERLVELHLPLVHYLAKRFNDRGQPLEDLVQVGSVGLLKAIDRFDLDRKVAFSTYATPTIVGEIKRHFRDKGWSVRVPRRLQELSLRLGKATNRLHQELGRAPTVDELAEELGVTHDEALEAYEASMAYSTGSLDQRVGKDEDSATVGELMGDEDKRLDQLEHFASIAPAVADLDERERTILYLRFFKGLTQSQIAEQVGISQMHVSRQLARTIRFLRDRQQDSETTF